MAGHALPGPRGQTFKMDPAEINIPPKGHFLHDPESPATPDPGLITKIDNVGWFGVITVTKIDNEVFVLLGRERVLAAREANRLKVERGDPPIRIEVQYKRCPDPSQAVRMMISENVNRRKVTTVAEARYMAMLRDTGWTEDMLAGEFDCSLGTIKSRLKLADQPDFVLSAVSKGEISAAKAKSLKGTNQEKRDTLKIEKDKGGAGATRGRPKKESKAAKAAKEKAGEKWADYLAKKKIPPADWAQVKQDWAQVFEDYFKIHGGL